MQFLLCQDWSFQVLLLCLMCVFQTQKRFSWKEASIQPQAMISESIWRSTLIFDRQRDFQESDILAAVRMRGWKFTAWIILSSSKRHRDTATKSSDSCFPCSQLWGFIKAILLSFAHSAHAGFISIKLMWVCWVCSVSYQGWLGQGHSHSTAPKSQLSKQESPAPRVWLTFYNLLQGQDVGHPSPGDGRSLLC